MVLVLLFSITSGFMEQVVIKLMPSVLIQMPNCNLAVVR